MTILRPNRSLRPALAAVTMLALLAAGCGDDGEDVDAGTAPGTAPEAPPDRPAEYAGEITSVSRFEPITEDCIDPTGADPDEPVSSDDPPFCTDPETAPLGTVLVEAVPGVQEGDKISLRVDDSTGLFRATEAGVEAIAFDGLAEGDQAEAWVDGPVADSYPQQGTATAILVTG